MYINKSKILVGSDFEFFLENKEGKIISAIPFNNGTKALPEPLDKKGCCIQRDGVLQECNVPPVPLDASDDFWENIEYVRGFLNEKLGQQGLKIKCCPSAILEKDQMNNKEAMTLGCDPDFNAWEDGAVNIKPKLQRKMKYFRTCGFHVHISYEDANIATSMELVKLFDLFLTVPFVMIDKDKQRRLLYGKAGSFRPQDWGNVGGVEFRTLSNKALEDKELVDYVFNQLNAMIDFYNLYQEGAIDEDKDKIVKAINESDEVLAKELCEKYAIPFLYENQGKEKKQIRQPLLLGY